jgi:hypothetical protein
VSYDKPGRVKEMRIGFEVMLGGFEVCGFWCEERKGNKVRWW